MNWAAFNLADRRKLWDAVQNKRLLEQKRTGQGSYTQQK